MSTYYVPGTTLGSWKAEVNKTETAPPLETLVKAGDRHRGPPAPWESGKRRVGRKQEREAQAAWGVAGK